MRRLLSALRLAVVLTACHRSGTQQDKDDRNSAPASSARSGARDDRGHEELPHDLTVSTEVIANAGIKTARLVRVALSEALSLPGEIAADPDRLARISSPAEGRIEEVKLREGAPVKKGDALVVIRVPEIAKVRAAHFATQSKAKAARANAERLRSLLGERLASEQAVLDAEAEADALEVEAKSTADQLGAIGAAASGAFSITLRAPINGIVVARDAVVGQPVSAERVLGTVVDLEQVWFLARVFEKDLGQLKIGANAEVHLNAYPDEHFAGTVEYIGQQIDSVARTVTARIRLRNHGGLLRLGLFGTSQVSTGAREPADPKLVVGSSSITEVGGKSVVFVRQAETQFELHEVTLGKEALGRVEVLAGLREGEEVVTDGVFTLKSLVLKGSFAEDEH